ncbi:DUF4129 domain-containing protein [Sutcliffiella deserti]|uniref:DUF4129 domain-containing protein n=1 Tax=Sutcliffiella deserti TaxID=2875501 RepID=UPI001CC0A3F1|nr:DUF4129 domain-containing protein [Sutcliffiella deserti]
MHKEDQARKELEEILNGKEYQNFYIDNRNSIQILWDDIKAWFADILARFFPAMDNAGGAAGNILFLIICIVVVALVVILIIMASQFKRNRSIGKQQPFQSESELDWTYHQHLEEAKKQEGLEDYTKSTRHMFLALLLFFHRKKWLEARIWKTNWEYYEELRKVKKSRAESFFNFALLFDRAAYGKQQIKREEYIPYRKEALQWFNDSSELDGKEEDE